MIADVSPETMQNNNKEATSLKQWGVGGAFNPEVFIQESNLSK